MRLLTLRGWIAAIVVGAISAALVFFGLLQIRHWAQDEAQLHEIVALIQQGRIQVGPPALPPQPQPALPPAPKKE